MNGELTIANPQEIVSTTAVESMTRAEVDIQIATARKYPRQLSLVKQRMLSFATLDEETAAGCFYTLPARKGGDGKPLQGPSIRLAEIAINSFQHIRAGSRIIADDSKFITAQGVVHDLENNVCVSIEVKRRVTGKDGRRYSDDMIATTGNAACSIALRNAAFRVIPLALVKPVYESAKRLAIGDGKSLIQRRSACLAHFAKLGVPAEKVLAAVSVRSAEDIQLEQIEVLMGFATAIKDGEVSIDDVFSPKPEPAPDEIAAPNFLKPAATEQALATAAEQLTAAAANPDQVPEVGVNQNRLAAFCAGEGASFDLFRETLSDMGQLEGNDANATAFADLSDKLCTRLLNAQAGLKRALAAKKSQGGAK